MKRKQINHIVNKDQKVTCCAPKNGLKLFKRNMVKGRLGRGGAELAGPAPDDYCSGVKAISNGGWRVVPQRENDVLPFLNVFLKQFSPFLGPAAPLLIWS